MQIHELPSGTLSNSDVTAIDNGTSTRKYSIGTAINTLNAKFSSSAETLSDVSWTNLLTKADGVYIIAPNANGSPNLNNYGSLVLFKMTAARIIAIATFDDKSAYIFAGTTANRAWRQISPLT